MKIFSLAQIITYIFIFLVTLLYIFLYSTEYYFYHTLNIKTTIGGTNVIELFATNMPTISDLALKLIPFTLLPLLLAYPILKLVYSEINIIKKVIDYAQKFYKNASIFETAIQIIIIQIFSLILTYHAGARQGIHLAEKTYTKTVNHENMNIINYEGKEISVHTVNCNTSICVGLTKVLPNEIQSIIYDIKSYKKNITVHFEK